MIKESMYRCWIRMCHMGTLSVFVVLATAYSVLTYRDDNKLGLWNPATRRFKLLIPPPYSSNYDTTCAIGFGVDPMTGEFKIVLLYREGKVSIYRSSVNSWTYLDAVLHYDHSFSASRTTYAATFSNGFCYWRTYRERPCDETGGNAILAFDMHKQVFEEIEMPIEDHVGRSFTTLGLHENSLALIYISSTDVIDVWSMKQHGCWTKVYDVVTSIESCKHYECLERIFDWRANGSWILDTRSCKEENFLSIATYCGWSHLYVLYKENLAKI